MLCREIRKQIVIPVASIDTTAERRKPMETGFVQEPIADDNGLLKLTGSIEHVIYSNEENGFAICDLGTDTDELITITGTMPYIGEGDTVTVYGRWVHNPKYGRQFKVEQSEKQLPADRASILRYLASGAIKGIGPKTAQRIVDTFGDESFDVIENHPDWLAEINGITLKRAHSISEDFKTKQAFVRQCSFSVSSSVPP